jgi:biopolymer transport protein ExbD
VASNRGISGRGRRKKNKGFELQLTSMMDVLTIIVVFLLKSYNTSLSAMTAASNIHLPYSISQENPSDSIIVVITPESITVDNERVMDFVQRDVTNSEPKYEFGPNTLDQDGRRIMPLFDSLVRAKNQSEALHLKSTARTEKGEPLPFPGILAVQADKAVHYDLVKKVLYTAGNAGFRAIRFIAMKQET